MRPPARIDVSRPDKQLWPASGITKRRYVDYLQAVSGNMLPWLRGRPMSMVRAPNGVDAEPYFQKSAPSYAPPWIRTVRIHAPSAGRDVDYVVCEDTATLTWLGNQAVVEFHPAPVRRDRLDRLDLLVVDIDPPEGAFDAAVEVTRLVLEVLDDLGLPCGIKTTGGKGIHVVVPVQRRVDESGTRRAADALASIVASRAPKLVTTAFRKADRAGRVMLDPSRNGAGATFVAPYSPRSNDRGTVSFPIDPAQLGAVDPGAFTLLTVPGLLGTQGPRRWAELAEAPRARLPARLLRRPD
jgi:DNA ligase D